MKKLVAALLLTLVGGSVALVGTTSATAASGSAQVTMMCLLRAQGYDSYEPAYYDTGVSMRLDVPDAVRPGQTVSLRGVLTLQFPEELRSFAADYVDTIDGLSDNASVRLGMNGRTTKLIADRWQTGPTPINNPLVVSAPISFPTFTVPQNASGAITIDLPRNDVAKNTIGSKPSTVAMTGSAQAKGPAWNFRYLLSCYRRDSGQGRIATIPVSGGGAGQNGAQGGVGGVGAGAATPGAAADAPADDAAAGAGGEAAPGEAGSADPFSASAGEAAGGSGGGTGSSADSLLSSSSTDGVRIPGWVLVVVGAGVCLLAAVYSAWLHLRLRAIRTLD